jgi:hypothetical protein
LRNSDYVPIAIGNKSKIRIPKYLYLKFGIGQGPDEKWDSRVSLPLISQVEFIF